MVSSAKVVQSIIEESGNLIKNKDKVKLKKAEDLLIKDKKKIKVDKKEVNVTKDGETETVVDVNKDAFKVKKPDVSAIDAQDILLKYKVARLVISSPPPI